MNDYQKHSLNFIKALSALRTGAVSSKNSWRNSINENYVIELCENLTKFLEYYFDKVEIKDD
jgi:hypothetical protein